MDYEKDDVNYGKCTYCGGNPECREHVIPVSYMSIFRSYDPEKNWIVPACNECNSLAGASVVFSIPEKAKLVLGKFKKRYSKFINQPEWTQEELNEVSYSIREMVWGAMVAKRVAIEKLEHLKMVSEYDSDYLRPDFVVKMMKEYNRMVKEFNRQKKKRKRKKKST